MNPPTRDPRPPSPPPEAPPPPPSRRKPNFHPAAGVDPGGLNGASSAGLFRPAVFGEALFDHFPDGTRALGGAPFNVAWHLRGFKADPQLISAVGDDEAGKEILSRMEAWGMDTSGVQIDPSHPTGSVRAEFENGEPRFRIEPGAAWDHIELEKIPSAPIASRTQLLYHGTLALREDTSRSALAELRASLRARVLVDVNLRDPWWTPEEVHRTVAGADCVKMNQGELGLLSGRLPDSRKEWVDAASAFRHDRDISMLVVTFGSDGVLFLGEDDVSHWQEAPTVNDLVDTVGAGDAFSAVVALGLFQGWPCEAILRRAVAFAADLCTLRGASPDRPDLYARHLTRWRHDP